MILIDTNVISELARPSPSSRVVTWLAENRRHLSLSTVSIGELAYGIESLPEGARRSALHALVQRLIAAYASQTLPVTERAAWRYGELMARSRSRGRQMSIPDGMIAAVALENGCALATRNGRDFAELDLRLVDPWSHGA